MMQEKRDIKFWVDCLSRVRPDDIFARCMITGQIKKLERINKRLITNPNQLVNETVTVCHQLESESPAGGK